MTAGWHPSVTRLLAVALVAVLGSFPHEVAAQVTLQVVDAGGLPIPGVRVDVMGRGEVLEVATSSSDGSVTLVTDRWAEARRLSLSYLGLRTLIVQVDALPEGGVLRMEPEATEIEGLTVVGRGELCPLQDEAEARRLWREVAERYAADTRSRVMSGTVLMGSGGTSGTDFHRIDESALVEAMFGRGLGATLGGDVQRMSLDARLIRDGYTWEPFAPGGLTTSRDFRRVYPALESWHSHHFASRLFGELHDLAVVNERESETTLAFCPNGTGLGSTLSGTLTLAPGERFVAAEWRFHTDEPDDGAGGWIEFMDHAEGLTAMPHLLSARGVFYRYRGAEPPFPDLPRDYSRWVTVLTSWRLHPPGVVDPCWPGGGQHVFSLPVAGPRGEEFRACLDAMPLTRRGDGTR